MNDRDSAVTLTREELYSAVWKEPMTKVAPRFGLSDVGLAKICRKFNITRPPVGYWAKLAHGKDVEKPPLPDLEEADLIEIRRFREAFLAEQQATKPKAPPEVIVAERLANAHPHVALTKKAWNNTQVMQSLDAIITRRREQGQPPLGLHKVVKMLRPVATALHKAHRFPGPEGAVAIIHRDLKPENLWLDGSGVSERLRLLDFGIAKWTGVASTTAQTQAGLVVGTPEYLAPEQAVGGDVDHRADLYSTGVLAYVLLSGRHPFDTRDVRALLAAHAYRAVPSPSTVMPELAAYPRLLEFVARAAEKDREKRPGSARELIQLLEGAEFPVRLSRSNLTQSRNTPSGLAAARASLLGIPAARMPDVPMAVSEGGVGMEWVVRWLACAILLLRRIDRLRAGATLEEVLYIPSPKALKRMSLGYTGLTADIYWTRAVQYFGGKHRARAREYGRNDLLTRPVTRTL